MHTFTRSRPDRLHHHGHTEEDESDQSAKKWPEEATEHRPTLGTRMRFSQAAERQVSAARFDLGAVIEALLAGP
jgi:hypothetical protein